MSDAEFRELFARFDPSAEPRPESVERLLAEIDCVIGQSGDAGAVRAGGEGPYFPVERDDHQLVALARPRAQRRRAIAVVAAVAAVIAVIVAVAVTRPGANPRPKPVTPPHLPPPQLYWQDGVGIGRANLDGTGEETLINRGGGITCGIMVDRNYVYWADGNGAVDRAKRDGTGIDTRFIVTSGNGSPPTTPPGTGFSQAPPPANSPACLAVDGAHVYWTSSEAIGRANLDGTGIEENFIPVQKSSVTGSTCGLAVDRSHIYWDNGATGTIGRANLDGTGAVQDFIVTGSGGSGPTGGSGPAATNVAHAMCGLLVDGAHIYWGTGAVPNISPTDPTPPAPGPDGAIGRANLDGTGVDNSFITRVGVSLPIPCAEDGAFLYWASLDFTRGPTFDTIGRARLDATDVQPGFVTGPSPTRFEGPGCAIGR
jgi:hypothetical protein